MAHAARTEAATHEKADVQARVGGDDLIHQRPPWSAESLAGVRCAHHDVRGPSADGRSRHGTGDAAVGLDEQLGAEDCGKASELVHVTVGFAVVGLSW